jgi:hypothetical protein
MHVARLSSFKLECIRDPRPWCPVEFASDQQCFGMRFSNCNCRSPLPQPHRQQDTLHDHCATQAVHRLDCTGGNAVRFSEPRIHPSTPTGNRRPPHWTSIPMALGESMSRTASSTEEQHQVSKEPSARRLATPKRSSPPGSAPNHIAAPNVRETRATRSARGEPKSKTLGLAGGYFRATSYRGRDTSGTPVVAINR